MYFTGPTDQVVGADKVLITELRPPENPDAAVVFIQAFGFAFVQSPKEARPDSPFWKFWLL